MDWNKLTQQLLAMYEESPLQCDMQITMLLSGPHRKKMRQEYMKFLTGNDLPLSKCGIITLTKEILKYTL